MEIASVNNKEIKQMDNRICQKKKSTYGSNGFWNIVTTSFNRDIIVLFKVDTSVLTVKIFNNTEKLTFSARVSVTNVVNTVLPVALAFFAARSIAVIAIAAVLSAIGTTLLPGRTAIPAIGIASTTKVRTSRPAIGKEKKKKGLMNKGIHVTQLLFFGKDF
jgi:hypothetical protein